MSPPIFQYLVWLPYVVQLWLERNQNIMERIQDTFSLLHIDHKKQEAGTESRLIGNQENHVCQGGMKRDRLLWSQG